MRTRSPASIRQVWCLGRRSTGRWASWQATISNVGTLKDPVDRRITEQIQGVYDRQPRDTRLRAAIRGAHLKGQTGWRSAFSSPAFPELVELP